MGPGPKGPNFKASRPGLRDNFHVIVQTGLGPVLSFCLFLYFRHPSISEEKKLGLWLVETTGVCAEEFWVQMHAIY